MTRDDVVKLAEDASRKRAAYQMYAQSNSYGLTSEQLVSLDAAATVAKDEWLNAEIAYKRGLDILARPTPQDTKE